MKIVADNTVPYLKGIAEPIAEVSYLNSKEFTPKYIQDADVLIIRSINKCTRELLKDSQVKLITTATIGFDHIDTQYCEEAGITWKNSPGCNAVSVAQYVLAGIITIALHKKENLSEKTIGIVGVGLEMSFLSLCKECLHFCKGISVYEANVSVVCIELVFVISVF